jgi:hypothetical protein
LGRHQKRKSRAFRARLFAYRGGKISRP